MAMNFPLPPANIGPSFNVIVTQEQFNLFHYIDRQLFTRLVVGLDRDISESINVMAFIMWIERKSKEYYLVAKILRRWPDTMLSNLADEAIVVLNCIESNQYPNPSITERNLPLIQSMFYCNITLDFFHEKRIEVITEVTKFINHVCVRAFADIIEKVHYEKVAKEQNELYLANVYRGISANHHMQPQPVVYCGPNGVPMAPQQIVVPQWNESEKSSNDAFDAFDVSGQMDNYNPDMNDVLANLTLDDIYANTSLFSTGNDMKKEKPVDDRTLFMTFSKGYPISENEVIDFFTRKYGDIVDRMIMQEANPPEHPLYARLVVRPEAIHVIDHFLEYKPKIKFAINGKHVWARKYVRKVSSPFEAGSSKFFP